MFACVSVHAGHMKARWVSALSDQYKHLMWKNWKKRPSPCQGWRSNPKWSPSVDYSAVSLDSLARPLCVQPHRGLLLCFFAVG